MRSPLEALAFESVKRARLRHATRLHSQHERVSRRVRRRPQETNWLEARAVQVLHKRGLAVEFARFVPSTHLGRTEGPVHSSQSVLHVPKIIRRPQSLLAASRAWPATPARV